MEGWQMRVLEEQKELDDRLVKLQTVLACGRPNYILQEDWSLLHDQHLAMMKYIQVLDARIKRFPTG